MLYYFLPSESTLIMVIQTKENGLFTDTYQRPLDRKDFDSKQRKTDLQFKFLKELSSCYPKI